MMRTEFDQKMKSYARDQSSVPSLVGDGLKYTSLNHCIVDLHTEINRGVGDLRAHLNSIDKQATERGWEIISLKKKIKELEKTN